MNTPISDTDARFKAALALELDDTIKAEFLGLAEHIGIDPQTALTDAITQWIGQNAAIFEYTYGTEIRSQENK